MSEGLQILKDRAKKDNEIFLLKDSVNKAIKVITNLSVKESELNQKLMMRDKLCQSLLEELKDLKAENEALKAVNEQLRDGQN